MNPSGLFFRTILALIFAPIFLLKTMSISAAMPLPINTPVQSGNLVNNLPATLVVIGAIAAKELANSITSKKTPITNYHDVTSNNNSLSITSPIQIPNQQKSIENPVSENTPTTQFGSITFNSKTTSEQNTF